MTTPGLAIGGMLARRHHRGLAAVALCLAAGAAVAPAADVSGLAWVLFMLGVCYVVAVFGFGFDTDVAAAGTCYPSRMFTLPVRTAELAGWPLLFGTTALAGMWVAAAGLMFQRWGLKTPLGWPALLGATQFAWLTALLWWPFGLPWARVGAGIAVGHVPAAGVIYLAQTGHPSDDFLVYLWICLGVGVAASYAGVASARRGSVRRRDWVAGLERVLSRSRPERFESAARAQTWYEWRRNGRSLPFLVAGILPFVLLPFFLTEQTPASLVRDFIFVLIVPVGFAGMAGTVVGKQDRWVKDSFGLPSFIATRPVSSTALAAAMMRSAARSTMITWAIAVTMAAATVLLSGAGRATGDLVRHWFDVRPTAEVVAAAVMIVIVLPMLTWKRLMENLLTGSTGRDWVVKASQFAGVFLLLSLITFGFWLFVTPRHHETALAALPWVLAVAVGSKFTLAGVVLRLTRRKQLVTDRTIALLAGIWVTVFATLLGLAECVRPVEVSNPWVVAMAITLAMPLTRVSSLPLLLDRNRHR